MIAIIFEASAIPEFATKKLSEMDERNFRAVCGAAARSEVEYGQRLVFPPKKELWKLLLGAGLDVGTDPDFRRREPSVDWIVRHLNLDRSTSQMLSRFNLASTDPLRFVGQDLAYVTYIDRLNDVLSLNGLGVEIVSGVPTFVEVEYSYRPFGKKPTNEQFEYIDTAELLPSPDWSDAVELRFKEAGKCRTNGSYLAGIVMLGSGLETLLLGILLENSQGRQKAKRAPRDTNGIVRPHLHLEPPQLNRGGSRAWLDRWRRKRFQSRTSRLPESRTRWSPSH